MKILFLSFIWLPFTLLMLYFSLVTLNNLSYLENANSQVLAESHTASYYDYYINDREINLSAQQNQDARVLVLKKFFAAYKSPLIDSSELIIEYSDIYGIDYALIPAISMQESQGCKVIPPGSHNCWGFGIYGTKRTAFDSYETAIAAVAKTIKEAYIKRGLTNPTLLEDRWTPSSRGNWSYAVNFFIGKIRELEKNISYP